MAWRCRFMIRRVSWKVLYLRCIRHLPKAKDRTSTRLRSRHDALPICPSKRIDLKIKPGDPIKKGTLAHQALSTEQKISEFIHRNIFGVPYHGMAVPIHDTEGKLEGSVLAVYPALTEGK